MSGRAAKAGRASEGPGAEPGSAGRRAGVGRDPLAEAVRAGLEQIHRKGLLRAHESLMPRQLDGAARMLAERIRRAAQAGSGG